VRQCVSRAHLFKSAANRLHQQVCGVAAVAGAADRKDGLPPL
jgi:hypothetical protein